jgi:hypothetical protein
MRISGTFRAAVPLTVLRHSGSFRRMGNDA